MKNFPSKYYVLTVYRRAFHIEHHSTSAHEVVIPEKKGVTQRIFQRLWRRGPLPPLAIGPAPCLDVSEEEVIGYLQIGQRTSYERYCSCS